MRKLRDFERGHLSDGLRNSTDCPVKRVLEYHDEHKWKYHEFDEGVGTIGHILGEHFIDREIRELETKREVMEADSIEYFQGGNVTKELAINWGVGETHLDAVVWNGKYQGVWELKTFQDSWRGGRQPRLTPTPENIRQVYRQRVCQIIAGEQLPERWFIQRIGKDRGNLPDPFEVHFEQDKLDATQEEVGQVILAHKELTNPGEVSPEWFAEYGLECRCSQCWPKPRKEASQDVSALMEELKLAKAEYDADEAERKEAAERKKQSKKKLDDIRDRLAELIPDGEVVEDEDMAASKDKKGILRVREKHTQTTRGES